MTYWNDCNRHPICPMVLRALRDLPQRDRRRDAAAADGILAWVPGHRECCPPSFEAGCWRSKEELPLLWGRSASFRVPRVRSAPVVAGLVVCSTRSRPSTGSRRRCETRTQSLPPAKSTGNAGRFPGLYLLITPAHCSATRGAGIRGSNRSPQRLTPTLRRARFDSRSGCADHIWPCSRFVIGESAAASATSTPLMPERARSSSLQTLTMFDRLPRP